MGGKNNITAFSDTVGGNNDFASSSQRNRIIWPAIVRDIDDGAAQNRIRVEIVSINKQGEIKGGKDKDTPLDKLVICYPLLPEFLHVRPNVGEMVFVIQENPNDMSSPRYWIGPVRTSQTRMNYESFESAYDMVNNLGSFKSKEVQESPTSSNEVKAKSILPNQTEIALQGRNDTDITFKKREVIIRAGKFKKDTISINQDHQARIQIKQYDDADTIPPTTIQIGANENSVGTLEIAKRKTDFIPFSQTNIIGTNINLISTEGKNRNTDTKTIEDNTNKENLERFGQLADSLHPLVFGDNLVELLKIMISFMLNHIHTPQEVAISPLSDISKLQEYSSDSKMQEILSEVIRIN